jgi:hypothetical protein
VSKQFEKAERAIERAASAIEKAVANLIDATLPLEDVAHDAVVERLAVTLMERNPQAFDWLNRQPGRASAVLGNALMDWRDAWEDR